MSADRAEVRRLISNAFYDARNAGRTMEDAADKAADRITALVTSAEWDEAQTVSAAFADMQRRAEAAEATIDKARALRDDLLSFHGGHGDFRSAGRSLHAILDPDTEPAPPTED
jgi:hypothetical protein